MRLLLASLLLVPLTSGATSPAIKPPVRAELDYGLKVRIRSFKVDADLWAGAKLRMMSSPKGTDRTLTLLEPVEEPWKFYWVRPVIGREEVKYAVEAKPRERSWAGRATAEKAAERRGRELWRRWQKEWGGERAFDQAFAFFIIGEPLGRFSVHATPGGGVSKVSNRMTDRWLPTGFPDWVAGKNVVGYAFWADDPKPPEWQPNGYAALAEAVKVLSVPVSEGQVRHPKVLESARRVLETLVPKAKGQFSGSADVTVPMTLRTEGERRTFEGTSAPMKVEGMTLVLHRRVVLEPNGRPLSDRARVELEKGKALSLELSVGWGSD